MANIHEAGRSMRARDNGMNSIPVHDMPDFTAALEDYKTLLTEYGVPSQDADKAVDATIDTIAKSPRRRRDGNRFINFVLDLSKSHSNGKKPEK